MVAKLHARRLPCGFDAGIQMVTKPHNKRLGVGVRGGGGG